MNKDSVVLLTFAWAVTLCGMYKKMPLAVAGALALVLSTGLPAHAAEDSGHYDCDALGDRVHVRNNGSGTLANYTPDGTLRGSFYSPNVTIYRTGSNYIRASWRATASGSQNAVGTYAYCD